MQPKQDRPGPDATKQRHQTCCEPQPTASDFAQATYLARVLNKTQRRFLEVAARIPAGDPHEDMLVPGSVWARINGAGLRLLRLIGASSPGTRGRRIVRITDLGRAVAAVNEGGAP